jgi:hypothetical protein
MKVDTNERAGNAGVVGSGAAGEHVLAPLEALAAEYAAEVTANIFCNYAAGASIRATPEYLAAVIRAAYMEGAVGYTAAHSELVRAVTDLAHCRAVKKEAA